MLFSQGNFSCQLVVLIWIGRTSVLLVWYEVKPADYVELASFFHFLVRNVLITCSLLPVHCVTEICKGPEPAGHGVWPSEPAGEGLLWLDFPRHGQLQGQTHRNAHTNTTGDQIVVYWRSLLHFYFYSKGEKWSLKKPSINVASSGLLSCITSSHTCAAVTRTLFSRPAQRVFITHSINFATRVPKI